MNEYLHLTFTLKLSVTNKQTLWASFIFPNIFNDVLCELVTVALCYQFNVITSNFITFIVLNFLQCMYFFHC